MKISEPAPSLHKPNIKTLESGSIVHRIHDRRYSGISFNKRRDVTSRFSPICDIRGEVIPVLYVAETFEVAVCETIFHDVNAKIPEKHVSKVAIYTRAYTQIRITRNIKLASLRKQDLKKWLVTPSELIHSLPDQFDQTTKWSQEIHNQFDYVEGLIWTSNQCDPDSAIILFGDRVPEKFLEIVKVQDGMYDRSFLNDVIEIGQRSNTKIRD